MNEQLTVTAQQAEQSAMQFQRQMNSSRRIPPIPERLQRLANEEQIYLYNVGPFAQTRSLGSLGGFTIPACPEGAEYSAPLIIPGLVFEPYPIDDKAMEMQSEEGSFIAEQVLGVGKHIPAADSFAKFGVFIAKSKVPTKEELRKAKEALNAYLQALVSEMNAAAAQGPTEAKNTKSPNHVLAARILKKSTAECPWLADSTVQAERAECDSCGTVYKVGIMKCGSCGYILDLAKYEKNKARFA